MFWGGARLAPVSGVAGAGLDGASASGLRHSADLKSGPHPEDLAVQDAVDFLYVDDDRHALAIGVLIPLQLGRIVEYRATDGFFGFDMAAPADVQVDTFSQVSKIRVMQHDGRLRSHCLYNATLGITNPYGQLFAVQSLRGATVGDLRLASIVDVGD